MTFMTPSAQIEMLRKTARLHTSGWLTRVLFGLALALAIAGILSWHPMPFMIAFFVALLALASRETTPHIANAAKALESGSKRAASVEVSIPETSDTTRYYAVVRVSDALHWRMEFTVWGWKPREGTFQAEVFHIRGVEWPVLLQMEQGILFPRYTPQRLVDATAA
jgi:hypothetical protein